jgi:hypothetical protein
LNEITRSDLLLNASRILDIAKRGLRGGAVLETG